MEYALANLPGSAELPPPLRLGSEGLEVWLSSEEGLQLFPVSMSGLTQPPVTQSARDLTPFSALHGHLCMCGAYSHSQTHINPKKMKYILKIKKNKRFRQLVNRIKDRFP